jgi:hypothetical protein
LDFIIFEIKELGMTDGTQKWIQAHDGRSGDYNILDPSSNSQIRGAAKKSQTCTAKLKYLKLFETSASKGDRDRDLFFSSTELALGRLVLTLAQASRSNPSKSKI